MGTINSALSVMAGALDADQEALNVVANNVANANTPGYTEEKPDWQENTPIRLGGVLVGDGVTETGATSQRDRVLEERLDQQQQLASASSTRLTALNNMQALFTPDSGSSSSTAGDIGSDITSFFDSFSSLESDPTDNALREQVLSSASTLAGDISSAASSLNAQSAALDQEASGVVSQVNSLTSAIAQLNLEIESNSPNADAGTLEDQRQQDLSQLSQLIGINQVTTENNGLSVTTTSGQLLVSEGQSFQLTTGTVNGVTDFFLGGTDITSQLASGGGQLGGYLTARDVDIPSALSSLDQLAYDVSTSVNAAEQCRHGSEWRDGDGRQSSLYLQRAGAGGGKRGGDERDHDRSQPDSGGGIGRRDRGQLECRGDGEPCRRADREWADADQLLLKFCLHAGLDGFRGADGEHGAECFGDAVADAEQCAVEREPER